MEQFNHAKESIVGMLTEKCKNVRGNILKMVTVAGSGHTGGSLSGVEIVTTLYFHLMNVDPNSPKSLDRDRFILSKGHSSPLLYSVLAERGYFPKSELLTYKASYSNLGGHPDMHKVKGTDMTTGSLGQGLSVANGIAIAAKRDKKDNRVYVLLGDGEIQEGQVWEAAMAASHFKLGNVTAFIDNNRLQITGKTDEVMKTEPIANKFNSFGWNVIEIDGHNVREIIHAVQTAIKIKNQPTAIIAHTVKGKGVSYMENRVEWHGKAPSPEELEKALFELNL